LKLYHSPTSPYARKVRIVARECGVLERIELVTVPAIPHTPNRDLIPHNPLMKVPTLQRDDGPDLFDSIVICEYLDALGQGGLFPASGEPRWEALRRHALADGMLDASLSLRYERMLRPAALQWPEWIEAQFLRVDNALAAAEREVDGFPARLDIGQVGLVCALGYLDFRFADRPWRPGRPKLERWFARMSERPSVASTVPTA
jgi:glutathione S-transferase